ncbi:MAG: protein phosphatase 2C domain-containing protein [Planctomycetaceae bacterium]|jgi:protein phosphatase|nr:protein phosphatase 2C domain-containing protein [Planctomycetaceae bacterium]
MNQDSAYWKKGVRYTALSDIGLRRANNQDSYAVKIASTARQWLDRGHLFIVADGMGAHVAGEVASHLAVETVVQSYFKRTNESPSQALVQSVYDAHRIIKEKSRREDAYRDMGTTCDAFTMLPQGLLIAHVGDSRVYRVRNHVIEQLTFDHSLVWEVCMATDLPFNQAPSYIPKNQITRSLGPTEKLVVDLEGPYPITVGDTFLACSDGLSGQISDREIGELLTVFLPETAAETLVNLANLRGGPDNITVVIAQAVESSAATQEVDAELKIPFSSWLVLGATVLGGMGAIFGFLLGNIPVSGLFAVITVFTAVFFLMLAKKPLFEGSPFLQNIQSGGKVPYTQTACAPSHEFAVTLSKILYELRQATKGQQLSINSDEANQYEKKAVDAVKTQNLVVAIQNYAMAINLLMRELKKLSSKKKS